MLLVPLRETTSPTGHTFHTSAQNMLPMLVEAAAAAVDDGDGRILVEQFSVNGV